MSNKYFCANWPLVTYKFSAKKLLKINGISNFGVTKIWSKKKIGVKKNFGSKKFGVRKFGVKKNLGSTNTLG